MFIHVNLEILYIIPSQVEELLQSGMKNFKALLAELLSHIEVPNTSPPRFCTAHGIHMVGDGRSPHLSR